MSIAVQGTPGAAMKLHASLSLALLAVVISSAAAATSTGAADDHELSSEGAAARARALLKFKWYDHDDDDYHGGRCKVLSQCDCSLLVGSACRIWQPLRLNQPFTCFSHRMHPGWGRTPAMIRLALLLCAAAEAHVLQGGAGQMPMPLPWPLLPRALLLPQAVQRQALQQEVPPAVLPLWALPTNVPQALLPAATQGQCGTLCVLHSLQLPLTDMHARCRGICSTKNVVASAAGCSCGPSAERSSHVQHSAPHFDRSDVGD